MQSTTVAAVAPGFRYHSILDQICEVWVNLRWCWCWSKMVDWWLQSLVRATVLPRSLAISSSCLVKVGLREQITIVGTYQQLAGFGKDTI